METKKISDCFFSFLFDPRCMILGVFDNFARTIMMKQITNFESGQK